MNLEHLHEPRLQFARGTHICPRRGIAEYGVFDQRQETRRKEIYIGGVGTSQCIDLLEKWVNRCRRVISAGSDIKQENLRLPFCGFNRESGFGAEVKFSTDLSRPLKNSEIDEILKIGNRTDRVLKAIDYYYESIKFLAAILHECAVSVREKEVFSAVGA